MSYEQIFSLASSAAMAGWLLLVVLPRWRFTRGVVLTGALALLLSAVYALVIARNFPGAEGGFGSLSEVRLLFSNEALLLAGWIHYLAFDLLVGAFELRQAQADGIPHLVMIPVLLATFLLGPIGLLLFFVVRSVAKRRVAAVIP